MPRDEFLEYERLIDLFLSETDRGHQKSARMTIRMRPEEMEELKRMARRFGVEPSRFARRLVLIGLQVANRRIGDKHTNHV